MDEILPGWTVAREIPPAEITGLRSGQYVLHGGVIRTAAGTQDAGRIVRHLMPAAGLQPRATAAAGAVRAPATQQMLQMATRTMTLAGLNLAVSAMGFSVILRKLESQQWELNAVAKTVAEIKDLLELNEQAKLEATLDLLAAGVRNEELIRAALNVFAPLVKKYGWLLSEADTRERALACEEHLVLVLLANTWCLAELGELVPARRLLRENLALWADQARRIAGGHLLGWNPERFLFSEFVEHAPMHEIVEWMNFADGKERSLQEGMDELRRKISLNPHEKKKPLFGKSDDNVQRDIYADRYETIPALRKLVARDRVLQGYAAQYALLEEHRMKPSELGEQLARIEADSKIDGYVILEPTRAARSIGGGQEAPA